MTAIWQNDGTNWHLLVPTGFPNEATLHDLVEQASHLLPLAGSPRLIVIGREVQPGNGYEDLIVIEPAGRLAVIEIKLARNAEARRAVIGQVLAYAAYLWGMDQRTLEEDVLSKHLRNRGYESLAQAVASNDQVGSFDAEEFAAGISESLKLGRIRLVFILDDAPEELIRLVSYLETTFERLLIDLITISAYIVNGSQILVPQHVEAEPKQEVTEAALEARSKGEWRLVEGANDFLAGLDTAPAPVRTLLGRLCDWVIALEQARLVKPYTYHGKAGILTLLPRLQADNAGLVSIYNNNGSAYIQFWRSVFERRAPVALAHVEASIMPIKQGNTTREISDKLLEELTAAYKEANSRAIKV